MKHEAVIKHMEKLTSAYGVEMINGNVQSIKAVPSKNGITIHIDDTEHEATSLNDITDIFCKVFGSYKEV